MRSAGVIAAVSLALLALIVPSGHAASSFSSQFFNTADCSGGSSVFWFPTDTCVPTGQTSSQQFTCTPGQSTATVTSFAASTSCGGNGVPTQLQVNTCIPSNNGAASPPYVKVRCTDDATTTPGTLLPPALGVYRHQEFTGQTCAQSTYGLASEYPVNVCAPTPTGGTGSVYGYVFTSCRDGNIVQDSFTDAACQVPAYSQPITSTTCAVPGGQTTARSDVCITAPPASLSLQFYDSSSKCAATGPAAAYWFAVGACLPAGDFSSQMFVCTPGQSQLTALQFNSTLDCSGPRSTSTAPLNSCISTFSSNTPPYLYGRCSADATTTPGTLLPPAQGLLRVANYKAPVCNVTVYGGITEEPTNVCIPVPTGPPGTLPAYRYATCERGTNNAVEATYADAACANTMGTPDISQVGCQAGESSARSYDCTAPPAASLSFQFFATQGCTGPSTVTWFPRDTCFPIGDSASQTFRCTPGQANVTVIRYNSAVDCTGTGTIMTQAAGVCSASLDDSLPPYVLARCTLDSSTPPATLLPTSAGVFRTTSNNGQACDASAYTIASEFPVNVCAPAPTGGPGSKSGYVFTSCRGTEIVRETFADASCQVPINIESGQPGCSINNGNAQSNVCINPPKASLAIQFYGSNNACTSSSAAGAFWFPVGACLPAGTSMSQVFLCTPGQSQLTVLQFNTTGDCSGPRYTSTAPLNSCTPTFSSNTPPYLYGRCSADATTTPGTLLPSASGLMHISSYSGQVCNLTAYDVITETPTNACIPVPVGPPGTLPAFRYALCDRGTTNSIELTFTDPACTNTVGSPDISPAGCTSNGQGSVRAYDCTPPAAESVSIQFYSNSACTGPSTVTWFPRDTCNPIGDTASQTFRCSADKSTVSAVMYNTSAQCAGAGISTTQATGVCIATNNPSVPPYYYLRCTADSATAPGSLLPTANGVLRSIKFSDPTCKIATYTQAAEFVASQCAPAPTGGPGTRPGYVIVACNSTDIVQTWYADAACTAATQTVRYANNAGCTGGSNANTVVCFPGSDVLPTSPTASPTMSAAASDAVASVVLIIFAGIAHLISSSL